MNAKPSRNTKATIAAAAREEFARLGYAGARVERIARRAGVNKQLIFYYFGSKRGLYDSVVQGAAHGVLRGEQGKHDDPGAATDGLRRAVQQLFDDLQAQPDVTALLLHDARDADGSVELAGPVLLRMLNRISKVVSEGQGLGYFRDNANPETIARQAIVLALGYLALEPALRSERNLSREEWREGVSELLARALAW